MVLEDAADRFITWDDVAVEHLSAALPATGYRKWQASSFTYQDYSKKRTITDRQNQGSALNNNPHSMPIIVIRLLVVCR